MAERGLRRHDERAQALARPEHAQERLRLEAREGLVEGLHDELVDPERGHAVDELLGVAQARRRTAAQDGVGVGLEGHGRGERSVAACLVVDPFEHGPMTPVQAVEDADGDHARTRPVELGESEQCVHYGRSPLRGPLTSSAAPAARGSGSTKTFSGWIRPPTIRAIAASRPPSSSTRIRSGRPPGSVPAGRTICPLATAASSPGTAR